MEPGVVVSSSALAELHRRLGPAARLGEPLGRYTSARVGGPADLFVGAQSSDELVCAVEQAAALGVPWRIIGSASNLLIADEGVEGLVVKAATSGVRLWPHQDTGGVLVQAEAGAIFAAVAKQTALRGLRGLEWAVNVPGTIGASVVNNSGAFGSCAAEHLVEVLLHVPRVGAHTVPAEDLGLAYRTSRLKRGELLGVVLTATFRLVPDDPTSLRQRTQQIRQMRRATQPSGYSVGSMFTNPPGDAAGRLIEAAGLKGHRVADAEISALHANFMLNRRAARARDMFRLMQLVQSEVWERSRVWLVPEIEFVGRWSDTELQGLYVPPETGS